MLRQIFSTIKLTQMTYLSVTNNSYNRVTRANGLCHWMSDGSDTIHGQWTSKKEPIILQKKPDKSSRSIALKHTEIFVFQQRKMDERMDFFFLMFHDLENINDGQKRVKEKIHNTVESTKQQTSRIGPIFFPLVSFLILSTRYITLVKQRHALTKTFQQLPNLCLWKPHQILPSWNSVITYLFQVLLLLCQMDSSFFVLSSVHRPPCNLFE